MIIYDNGAEFSLEFTEMLDSFGITGRPTKEKNHQTNSFVERIHSGIAGCICAMDRLSRLSDENTTHNVLQAVAWRLRSTHHTALQVSPGLIAFDRDMVIKATCIAN